MQTKTLHIKVYGIPKQKVWSQISVYIALPSDLGKGI